VLCWVSVKIGGMCHTFFLSPRGIKGIKIDYINLMIAFKNMSLLSIYSNLDRDLSIQ
jgi:hypothetical protein